MIDELERVRRFRADEPEPTEAARAQARAALDAAISRPTRRRQRPRHRWWLRAALATTAVLAGVLVIELAGSGSDTGPAAAVAAALGRLADIAANGPSLVPARGQYLYVDSRNHYASIAVGRGESCVTYAPDHRQVWIAADGAGLDQDTEGAASYISPRDQSTCGAMKVQAP
jgi:hypothetical protein